MKYKIGDIVKVKSRKWWNEQPKSENGDIIKVPILKMAILVFGLEKYNNCCGRAGEVISVDLRDDSYKLKFNLFEGHSWFHEDWIEKKVEVVKIKLRQMKNEI